MNRHERRRARALSGAPKATSRDPRLDGNELLYGGRTLEVQVFLNTDESAEVVLERIKAVARGPKAVMTLYAVSEVDRAHAEKLWESTWNHAEATIAREKERN